MKPVLTLILVLLPLRDCSVVIFGLRACLDLTASPLLHAYGRFFFSGLSQYGSEVLLLSKKIDFALDVGSWMMELK